MKRNLSRIAILILALVMMLTSAMAVYADTADVTTQNGGENEAAEVTGSDESAPSAEADGVVVEPASEDPDAEEPSDQTDDDSVNEVAAGSSSSQPMMAEGEGYTITFDANGGTGSMENVTVTDAEGDGENYTLPKSSFTAPSGKQFDCWKAGDKTYAPGSVIAVTGDITVYAQWKAKTHTHSYGAWTTTVKPTYFKAGSKVRKCSCGVTQTQKVAKLTAKNKWVTDNGKSYYFGKNGKPVKGWKKVKPKKSKKVKWCYFTQKGVFIKSIKSSTKKKWVEVDGYKFYFTKKKKPAGYGFHRIKGKLYHMNKFGAVMYGTFKAEDGKKYTTDKKGVISDVSVYLNKYKTFIIIDLSSQKLRYYKNRSLKMTADVVTGTRHVHDTPTGKFKVRSKRRNINLVGPTWSSHVSYWMAFIGSSYGMHDATWRSSGQFSNHKTYLHNGSHGCVNMRYGQAKKLYKMVKVGTPVIVKR